VESRTGVVGWIRNYLALGLLWCVIVNVHAAVIGATSPLMAAAGPSTGMAKALDVGKVVAQQIVLWPLGIWEKVLQPIFG
jgi:hypothetical protein